MHARVQVVRQLAFQEQTLSRSLTLLSQDDRVRRLHVSRKGEVTGKNGGAGADGQLQFGYDFGEDG
jgi:hypothetical protein